MSERKYTLELTVEEVDSIRNGLPRPWQLKVKLDALAEQARGDRERDDLRLPWRAEPCGRAIWVAWESGDTNGKYASEPVAKLISAAPELLEAVQAAQRWIAAGQLARQLDSLTEYIERALRKVETGVPE